MLDLGWTELLVIGVVALIVIGPRDLPLALHTFGKYVGKLKAMARDFQSSVDDIARQHELKDLQEGINKFSSPEQAIENYVSNLEKSGAKPAAGASAASVSASGDGTPAAINTSVEDDTQAKADLIDDEPEAVKDWSAASAEIASPAAKAVAAKPIATDDDSEPSLPLEGDTASFSPATGHGTGEVAGQDEPELPLDNETVAGQPKSNGSAAS